jgi:hypothetical protein
LDESSLYAGHEEVLAEGDDKSVLIVVDPQGILG